MNKSNENYENLIAGRYKEPVNNTNFFYTESRIQKQLHAMKEAGRKRNNEEVIQRAENIKNYCDTIISNCNIEIKAGR